MGNDANPKKLTASATTTIGSVYLYNVCVNKTLTGTMAIADGAVNIGLFAIGTLPGNYHLSSFGVRYANLAIGLSAADDVSIFTRTA